MRYTIKTWVHDAEKARGRSKVKGELTVEGSLSDALAKAAEYAGGLSDKAQGKVARVQVDAATPSEGSNPFDAIS